jgi:hypothetical protein
MTSILVVLSELQHAQVTKLLTAFCESRVPAAVRDQLRHGFRIDGNAVELFESRPAFLPPHDWKEQPVAKFRYVVSRRHWQLYCQYRDLKWHEYEPRPSAASFEVLLREVAEDPTGIFWG